MQRRAIAALMISLLLLSACGHGAGEQTFEAFRDTLTGKFVTTTAQVRVQRGDTEQARLPLTTSSSRWAISTARA